MAVDPWIFAAHHLTTSHPASALVGHGAFDTVPGGATIVNDDTLGRTVMFHQSGAGSSNHPLMTKSFPSTDRIVFGFRWWAESLSALNEGFLLKFNNVNGTLINVNCTTLLTTMAVRRGTTNIATMVRPTTATWGYMEIALYFHPSEGRVITRLNGVEIDRVTGENTMNVAGGLTTIELLRGTQSNSTQRKITDFYMKDWPNLEENPFWGPISPLWRPVTSDVANNGFVASDAGAIYDSLLNSNSEFALPTVGGDTVEMGLAAIPGGTTFILGQVALAVSTAPAGGSGIVGLDFKDGVDVTDGVPNGRIITDQAAPTTQAVFHPAGPGNVPWTPELSNTSNLLLTAVSN